MVAAGMAVRPTEKVSHIAAFYRKGSKPCRPTCPVRGEPVRSILIPMLLTLSVPGAPAALAAQADVAGSSDHRLFPRIAGYAIASYRSGDPDAEQFRNGQGLARDTIEGRITRFRYAIPRGARPATSVGLVRHYEGVIQRLGGGVLISNTAFGELTARLVHEGREYWLHVAAENLEEYLLVIGERPAPVVVAAASRAGAPVGAAGMARRPGIAPRGARAPRLTAPPRLNLAPVIASFAPAARQSGELVRIAGTNLNRPTAVRFIDARGDAWDASVYSFEACSDNLKVVLPSLPAGQYRIAVSSPLGTGQSATTLGVFFTPVSERPDARTRLRVAMRRIVDQYQRRGYVTAAGAAGLLRRIDGGQLTGVGAALDAMHDVVLGEAVAAVGGPVSESVVLIALRSGRPLTEIAMQWRHCHEVMREQGIGAQGGVARAGVGIGEPPVGEGRILGDCAGGEGARWHSHVTPMSIGNAVLLQDAIRTGSAPAAIPAHRHTEAGFAAGTVWYASIAADAWYAGFVAGAMDAVEWVDEHSETIISVAKITGYVVVGTVGCAVGLVFTAGAGCAASFIAIAGPIAKETAKILVQEEAVTVDGVDKETLLAGIEAIPVG